MKKLSFIVLAFWLACSLPVLAQNAKAPKAGAVLLEEGKTALDKRQFQNAAQLFGKAFEGGASDGAFYLGRMLELGIGGGKADMAGAIVLYKKGSDKGSPLAKNRLGMLHLNGLGVLQDYETGAKMVCDAADQGDANGQFNCALVHSEGRGVKKDPKKAVSYLKKATAQNHIGAKNVLAQAYITGNGVKADQKKALELFQQTASQGNPVGLFSLGQAYTLGIGIEKDLIKAHAYFNLAATRQHPEALQARQQIERQLKPEQVVKAHRIARAWRPSGEEKKSSLEQAKPKKQ